MDATLGSLLTEPAAQEAVRVAPLVDGHDDLAWEAREAAGYSVEGLDADRAAFVIHAGPDDYKTDPSGNSGGRVACGVITAG